MKSQMTNPTQWLFFGKNFSHLFRPVAISISKYLGVSNDSITEELTVADNSTAVRDA